MGKREKRPKILCINFVQPSKPSLLTRALDKSRRTSLAAAPHGDLIIMDGGIKTVTDVIVDDGGMIRHELVIEEYKFDEDADTSDDVDQVTRDVLIRHREVYDVHRRTEGGVTQEQT